MVAVERPARQIPPMTVVLDHDHIDRALRRIAHEIMERSRPNGDLVLVGIHTRGVPLAARLSGLMARVGGEAVPFGALDVGPHRDDADHRPLARVAQTEVPGGVDDRVVVLVDDVLYTGRTIRAALDALTDLGRPRAVELAVLVDRGHREIPVRPDFVGKNLPTSHGERVTVRLTETDGIDAVRLEQATMAGRRSDEVRDG